MNVKMVYSLLSPDLKKIEKVLENVLNANSSLLQKSSLHYLRAGGKRIRPVFVILSAKFGDYQFHKISNVAVALELIHMASLIHDDVIDNADLRRGKPTVKAKWDNRVAMYTGDYVLARSLELITQLEDENLHKILSDTMVELSIGEIEQIRDKYDFDQSFTNYFRRIKRKTALLIAASCQLGAIAAGVQPEIHEKLFKFGYYVGMAFQITDDILDFTSDQERLGKPAGSDLLQGNITLPVLFALKNEKIRNEIVKVNEFMDLGDLHKIIELIKSSNALERANSISQLYVDKALKILNELPDYETKEHLRTIASFIGERKF